MGRRKEGEGREGMSKIEKARGQEEREEQGERGEPEGSMKQHSRLGQGRARRRRSNLVGSKQSG